MESCQASMKFIVDDPLHESEKPYLLYRPENEGGVRTNILFYYQDVPARNARGFEGQFSLAKHGFQWMSRPSSVRALPTTEQYIHDMLAESMKIIEKELPADKVIGYDCRLRRNVSASQILGDCRNRTTPVTSALEAHVDQTPDGAWRRVMRHLRDDEAELMAAGSWRVRIVNLWRPLYHPVVDSALAVCDFNTVSPSDLVATDHVNSDYHSEIYYMKYNREQQWYWLREQTPDEVLMFITFDSDSGSDAKYCPHVAFQDPTTTNNGPIRESIEVRAMIFNESNDGF
ncbi:hypothetical protein F4808DRAFT_443267 [Astrocystis sublimbata]|nr:hypothetical protein F4808DRAFT_443267 [Astrocystis sublimbata]